ncbi:MAG: hypothetical protein FWH26_00705 [Oscillospiraceae bacterium]|nr:hypothetical protein [Oscillospiraceae bacterium]
MKQSKRLLAFLLAVVMLASTLVVSTSAGLSLPSVYQGNLRYDNTGKIILSTHHYATALLDKLDELLKGLDVYLPVVELLGDIANTLGLGSLVINLRSIDQALGTLNQINGLLAGTLGGLIPMLSPYNLKLDYVTPGSYRRTNTGDASTIDTTILVRLLMVFADPDRNGRNGELVSKLLLTLLDPDTIVPTAGVSKPRIEANLGGLVGNLLKGLLGDFNIPNLLKGLLWGIVYPEDEGPVPSLPSTLDEIIETLVFTLLGRIDPFTNNAGDKFTILDLLGGIDVTTDSVYTLLEKIVPGLYDKALKPVLDVLLKPVLAEAAETAGLTDYLKLDYQMPSYDAFCAKSVAEGVFAPGERGVVGQINTILGMILTTVIDVDAVNAAQSGASFAWDYTDNGAVLDNFIAGAKTLVKVFSDKLFTLTPMPEDSQIDSMPEEDFIPFFARAIMNEYISYVYIPEDADTLTKVINYLLIELSAYVIPNRFPGYVESYYGANAAQLDEQDTLLDLLADYLVKLLYFLVDTNVLSEGGNNYDRSAYLGQKQAQTGAGGALSLAYGDGFDTTIAKLINWIIGNFGGLFAPSKIVGRTALVTNPSNAWATLNNVFFSIWDPVFLNGGPDGTTRGLREFLVEDVIGTVLSLDIGKLLSLLTRVEATGNPNTEVGLNKTVVRVLVKLIFDLVNLVGGQINYAGSSSPAAIITPEAYTTFTSLDSLLHPANAVLLCDSLGKIITGLGAMGDRLVATVVPFLTDILGMVPAQGYRPPSIDLPAATPYEDIYVFRYSSSDTMALTVINEGGGVPQINYNASYMPVPEIAYSYNVLGAEVWYSNGVSNVQASGVSVGGIGAGLLVTPANPTGTITLGNLNVNAPLLRDKMLTIILEYDVYETNSETLQLMEKINGNTPIRTPFYVYMAHPNHYDQDADSNFVLRDYSEYTKTDQGTNYNTGAAALDEGGYAAKAVYLQTFFFDRNSTLKDLLNIGINITRPNDLGVFDAEGEQIVPPLNDAPSWAIIDDYYSGYAPGGDYKGAFAADTVNAGASDLLNYLSIKDPYAPDALVELENGDTKTLYPFALIHPTADPDTKLWDLFGNRIFDVGVYLRAGGTAEGTKSEPFVDDFSGEMLYCSFSIAIESDRGMREMVGQAISRDVQRSNYNDSGGAFDNYINALSNAAWITMKPKGLVDPLSTSSLNTTYTNFTNANDTLLSQVKGGTTDALQALVNQIVESDNEDVPYYDSNYFYMEADDFVNWKKSKDALDMALSLIERDDPTSEAYEKLGPPGFLEVGYCVSLLNKTWTFKLNRPNTYIPSDYYNLMPLPTVGFMNPMSYRYDQLTDSVKLGHTELTFGEIKTLFYTANGAGDPYEYEGDYLGLSNESIHDLMHAYENVEAVLASIYHPVYGDEYIDYILGQGAPGRNEFLADLATVECNENVMAAMGEPEGWSRVPQSRLNMAQNMLVYALKHVVGEKEEGELDWTKIKAAQQAFLDSGLAEVTEPEMAYFIAEYGQACIDAATTVVELLEQESDPPEGLTTTELDAAAKALQDAMDLTVAIIPTEDAYIYDGAGAQSKLTINLDEYRLMATQTWPKSVRKALADGDEGVQPIYTDNYYNDFYDGYIYGLDIGVPSMNALGGKSLPYKVINGSVDYVASPAPFNKCSTGAKLLVKDRKGEVLFTLKLVYFGDHDGNGTILTTTEQADVLAVAAGKKWDPEPGLSTVQTIAMNVHTNNVIDTTDALTLGYKMPGTRYVKQSYSNVGGPYNLVTPGGPILPP